VFLVVDADDVLAVEDVLLVFDVVRVFRHARPRFEGESPDGEVWRTVIGADENALRHPVCRGHGLVADVLGAADYRCGLLVAHTRTSGACG